MPAASLQVLTELRFAPTLEREMAAALKQVMSAKIVVNRAQLERGSQILLVPRGGQPQRVEKFDTFLELEDARGRLRQVLAERLELAGPAERALSDFAESFLNVNVRTIRRDIQILKDEGHVVYTRGQLRPDEEIQLYKQRVVDSFHAQIFSPRIDLSRIDINSLDGSNRVTRNPLEMLTP